MSYMFAGHRFGDLENKRNASNLAISIQPNVNDDDVKKTVVFFLHQVWNVNQIVNT